MQPSDEATGVAPPRDHEAPPPPYDLFALYRLMRKCRAYEDAVARLWRDGLISGEMHLGTGEEAVVTGVVAQLRPEDALALDHRGTAACLLRGVDPVALLRELLGRPDGLCGGRGGHMHLFSRDLLTASSGIVGAAGPAAAGFALAARYLRPGAVAVAFFGDGAVNQGMLLESINLAAVWRLPVLFVCKDDGWAITTRPEQSTAGSLDERSRGLGATYVEVDGLDVEQVWRAAGGALAELRAGGAPVFLHARCVHLEGHFLGLQLLRAIRDPLRELPGIALPLTRALVRRGGGTGGERRTGVRSVVGALRATMTDPRQQAANDPLVRARAALTGRAPGSTDAQAQLRPESAAASPAVRDLDTLDRAVEAEIAAIVAEALEAAT